MGRGYRRGRDNGLLRYGCEETALCGGCEEILQGLLKLLRSWDVR